MIKKILILLLILTLSISMVSSVSITELPSNNIKEHYDLCNKYHNGGFCVDGFHITNECNILKIEMK